MEISENNSINPEKALTSIRGAYTLPCTPRQNSNEINQIMINKFLTTLSQVALAIASRQSDNHGQQT
jgi:hypothetical protein